MQGAGRAAGEYAPPDAWRGDVQDASFSLSSLHKQAEAVSDTCLFVLMLSVPVRESPWPGSSEAVNNISRHPAGVNPTSRFIHASIILHKHRNYPSTYMHKRIHGYHSCQITTTSLPPPISRPSAVVPSCLHVSRVSSRH